MTTLQTFQKQKEYLICVDSDGCAMDTMDCKHIRCFGPCMVQEWQLDAWKPEILKRWNEVNLYTMTRGVNRFKGLAIALGEINARYCTIPGIDVFADWTKQAKELSNRALEEKIAAGADSIFAKALHWSKSVNKAIEQMPEAEKKTFPHVAEGLAAAHRAADVAVVSSANREAVIEEWKRCGLLEYVDVLCCQEAGTKSACLCALKKQGYAPDHILMVGDAPGDQIAAAENGVYFYPIMVRHEPESWTELTEKAIPLFVSGGYTAYGENKEKEFRQNLGE